MDLGGVQGFVHVQSGIAGSKHNGNALLPKAFRRKEQGAVGAAFGAPRIAGNAHIHAGVHSALDVREALDLGIGGELPLAIGCTHADELGTVGGTAHTVPVPCRSRNARAVGAMAVHIAGVAAVASGVEAVFIAADPGSIAAHIEHDTGKVGVGIVDTGVNDGNNTFRVFVGAIVPILDANIEALLVKGAVGRDAFIGIAPLKGGAVCQVFGCGDGGFVRLLDGLNLVAGVGAGTGGAFIAST